MYTVDDFRTRISESFAIYWIHLYKMSIIIPWDWCGNQAMKICERPFNIVKCCETECTNELINGQKLALKKIQ